MRAERTLSLLFVLEILITGAPLVGPSDIWAQNNQEPTFQERYPRYRLRPGDVLELNFVFSPEFNQSVVIQPDGYVNLRGVPDVRVQDKTVPDVVQMLQAAYSKILRDPTITVDLKDFEKPYFVVGGEVTKPGKYDLRGDTTVLEAITIAGGVSDKSKTSQVLVFRRVSDDWVEVKQVDIRRMVRERDLSEDLHLRPGDMVLVPKSMFSKLARFIPVPSLGMYFNPLFR